MSQLEHHCVSILIERPAKIAFAYLADPARLGDWAFENASVDPSGVASGASRYDRRSVFARIDADQSRLTVDYHVGADRSALAPRIFARIVPGKLLDLSDTSCGVTLLAWRSATMDDLRWRQLVAAHEMEILLIKRRIETQGSH